MSPRYPFPWRIAVPLLWDTLTLDKNRNDKRSFRADAQACINLLSPPLKIHNPQHIPRQGPALLAANHYTRPGLRAWWIALAISASIPLEIHWMMTNAWTFLGPLTPLSHWVLTRMADVYGFTASPPMPPRPDDTAARAQAVRRLLEIARRPGSVIALAPEGRDQPGGKLGPLPPGAGRFIEKIAESCQPIVPIGVYEDDGALCLRFGPPFTLAKDPLAAAKQRDKQVREQVAEAIGRQLPPSLRTNTT